MEKKEKSLYEMLEHCTYILANSVEEAYEEASWNYNDGKNEAMNEWKIQREYNELMKWTEFYNLENQKEYKKIKEKHAEKKLVECFKLMSKELKEEIYAAISESDYPDINQTFIITKDTKDILKQYGEITWYNEDLELYFWGVTHCGTHWSYIMWQQYPLN